MSKFLNLFSIFSLFLITFLISSTHARTISPANDYLQPECVKTPIPQFLGSLSDTIGIIRDVTGIISDFGNFFGDSRLDNAINDCLLDLLDFSADELSWSMSASKNPKAVSGRGLVARDITF